MQGASPPSEAGVPAGRDTLEQSVADVHAALVSAEKGRSLARWDPLQQALGRLREVFREQITRTEQPDGLFQEILSYEPRLAHAIDRLRTDHEQLMELLDGLQGQLALADEPGAEDPARGLGDDTRELIRRFQLYSHRSEQLVYEAYNVDVATGD